VTEKVLTRKRRQVKLLRSRDASSHITFPSIASIEAIAATVAGFTRDLQHAFCAATLDSCHA